MTLDSCLRWDSAQLFEMDSIKLFEVDSEQLFEMDSGEMDSGQLLIWEIVSCLRWGTVADGAVVLEVCSCLTWEFFCEMVAAQLYDM